MIRQKGTNDKNLSRAEKIFEDILHATSPCGVQIYRPHKIYHRLFSPIVLLWCLLFQRLNADHSCDAVVAQLRSGSFDHLESQAGKLPISQRCRSESNAGYCQARKRLSIEVLERALSYTVEQIRHSAAWLLQDINRPVYLLDGSTLTLRPHPELERVLGRHKTVKKLSYWVIMRITVLFCLHTGSLVAVKEGSLRQSEVELGKTCLLRQPAGYICVADRGFGMFSIVQSIQHTQGDALVRLSRPRAKKLYPQQLYPGADLPVTWQASDRDHVDPTMSLEPVQGRIIYTRLERAGFRSQDLYLFTTLLDRTTFPASKLVALYGLRWHVEVHLRYVKRTLDLYLLEGKSLDIVRKELLAGLLAYNLLRCFMILAAHQAGCQPYQLSVNQSLRRVTIFLFETYPTPVMGGEQFTQLILRLAECQLRQADVFRIEPRWVRPKDKTYPEFWSGRDQARAQYVQNRSRMAVW